jgi:MYXO-CTERM domain-containing protein
VSSGDCQIVSDLPNLPDDGSEEECTYVGRALEGLCATGTSTVLCGGGGGACDACRVPGDCSDGFSCVDSACLPSCGAGMCPVGYECLDDGLCHPPTSFVCDGVDVVSTRCGRETGVVETCDDFCLGGVCVAAPPGDTCDDAIEIEPVTQTLRGTNSDRHSSAGRGGCITGPEGVDTLYTFTLDRTHTLSAYADGSRGLDPVLHLRRVCDDEDTELICDDDGGRRRDSQFDVELEAGSYTLFMDSWGETLGDYQLDLTFVAIGLPDAGPPDAGSDAGPGDAGPPIVDGGRDADPPVPPLLDAGLDSGRRDAGPPRRDAGIDAGIDMRFDAGFDAGDREFRTVEYAWCNCRVPGPGHDGPWPALTAGFLAMVALRRRT